ncbi:mitochondrial outer membrane protein mmm1 [Lasallia pustulata]|uniref:Maintenance of mitochondrial morphology protein 1 n=1 Tax=Lasallia pustulata TaxID=136370 RepID=A0A1W5CY27_9LECA|nr:mitochondrial outer membrane protein mmm1 [Lasallia pustulata]
MSTTQYAPSPTPPQQSSLSFTQGFLLGQLSVVILIGAFIKFFIFGEPPSPETTASARALARRNRALAHRRSVSINSSPTSQKLHTKRSSNFLRTPTGLTTGTILSKTYYNVNSHQPESLDWFNVLIAQTIAQFRDDAHQDDAILTSLTAALNGSQKPDFLSSIAVTEISLGDDFPIFSNCRVHPVDDDVSGAEGGRLQARMDVDLSDSITLGVETKIVLNYPKPLTAILPIALAVSVVRFSGTLSISFLPSTSAPNPAASSSSNTPSPASSSLPPSTTPTTLAFSFLPDYRLDLSVRSLLGSRSRLQDVPKIAQLVENRLHAWFDERCVEPTVQQVVLPSLWPRKKNTRGPTGEEEAKGEERDVREEARREGEDERRAERERREDAEGLRWRSRHGEGSGGSGSGRYEMPGAMPGMMVA